MSIGDLLVVVAAADGVISPDEVTSLSKIFKLLGLNPADVHSRLHAFLSGGRPAPATNPVTMREAGASDPGYPIRGPDETTPESPAESFSLDPEVIQAKFAETAAAGALLADIFKDDEPDSPTNLQTPTVPDTLATIVPSKVTAASAFDGLDPAHSQFLSALLAQGAWSRGAFEELAEEHNLMPDGALDTINEFALDVANEPLLEEDDSDAFTINGYAREELLA
jgi:hypothetical protein